MYIVDILDAAPVHAANAEKEQLDNIKVGEKNQHMPNLGSHQMSSQNWLTRHWESWDIVLFTAFVYINLVLR